MSRPFGKYLVRLHNDQEGQGLVEYLLIIAMLALGAAAGLRFVANGVNTSLAVMANFLRSLPN